MWDHFEWRNSHVGSLHYEETHMWDHYIMKKTHMWDRVKVLKRWWQAVPVVDLGKQNATDGNIFCPKTYNKTSTTKYFTSKYDKLTRLQRATLLLSSVHSVSKGSLFTYNRPSINLSLSNFDIWWILCRSSISLTQVWNSTNTCCTNMALELTANSWRIVGAIDNRMFLFFQPTMVIVSREQSCEAKKATDCHKNTASEHGCRSWSILDIDNAHHMYLHFQNYIILLQYRVFYNFFWEY